MKKEKKMKIIAVLIAILALVGLILGDAVINKKLRKNQILIAQIDGETTQLETYYEKEVETLNQEALSFVTLHLAYTTRLDIAQDPSINKTKVYDTIDDDGVKHYYFWLIDPTFQSSGKVRYTRTVTSRVDITYVKNTKLFYVTTNYRVDYDVVADGTSYEYEYGDRLIDYDMGSSSTLSLTDQTVSLRFPKNYRVITNLRKNNNKNNIISLIHGLNPIDQTDIFFEFADKLSVKYKKIVGWDKVNN